MHDQIKNRLSMFASLFVFLLIGVMPAQAQHMSVLSNKDQRLDQVFAPGYVDFSVPLSIFLPKSLASSLDALYQNKRITAANGFSQEIKLHPEDLAAYVGYLQSVPDEWVYLYPQYQREATAKPSPENSFKLGLLAFYLASGRIANGETNDTIQILNDISRQNLRKAYQKKPSPLIGFTLADAGEVSIYEQMLKQTGGDTVYESYKTAQSKEWMVNQPPVPELSAANIQIFIFIVRGLIAAHSTIGSQSVVEVVDGKSVNTTKFDSPTLEQQHAKAFLSQWLERLKAAAQRKS